MCLEYWRVYRSSCNDGATSLCEKKMCARSGVVPRECEVSIYVMQIVFMQSPFVLRGGTTRVALMAWCRDASVFLQDGTQMKNRYPRKKLVVAGEEEPSHYFPRHCWRRIAKVV